MEKIERISFARNERVTDVYFDIPSQLMTVKILLRKPGKFYNMNQPGFAVEQ
jgi:hypothetical protein